MPGEGIIDRICSAAKARIREQVRNKGKGSIVVQSSADFATVASKLLSNVKIIHTDEAEIQSTITKLDPWNIVCETSGVSNSHVANCTESVFKMWHTTTEMDELPFITVKYDNMPLPFPLPSDQVADRIPDWVHNIIIGDWVIVQYDNVRYPGDVTNIKGEDIQVGTSKKAFLSPSVWPRREYT